MEEFEPVLDYELKLGKDTLSVDISEYAHKLSRVWVGETHSHSRFEAHVLFGGRCRVDVEDGGHILREGQMVVIPPGQHHRLISLSDSCERFTVGITVRTAFLRQAMADAVSPCRILTMDGEFTALCRGILEECEAGSPYHRELIRLQLGQLAILLLRRLNLEEVETLPASADRNLTFDIIDNYFESNIALDPSADELAQLLHISRRHLNRILQASYGMGFREKLLRARMDQAAWLLRHTQKSVSVIAGEVGYTYDSAFRQAFRSWFRMTPLEYRVKHQRKDETAQ